ncbi:hypothetical protein BDF21DRAFT_245941 [Thamnidium elegans]|nr:hypothetical protein BDF21DRAFT_245941 [Thamnidium elegans]
MVRAAAIEVNNTNVANVEEYLDGNVLQGAVTRALSTIARSHMRKRLSSRHVEAPSRHIPPPPPPPGFNPIMNLERYTRFERTVSIRYSRDFLSLISNTLSFPVSNYLRIFQSEGMTQRLADSTVYYYALDIWNVKTNTADVLVRRDILELDINHLKTRELLRNAFVDQRVYFVPTAMALNTKFINFMFLRCLAANATVRTGS